MFLAGSEFLMKFCTEKFDVHLELPCLCEIHPPSAG